MIPAAKDARRLNEAAFGSMRIASGTRWRAQKAMPMGMLTARNRQPELMDQPGLDPELHRRALRGLQRVNAVSATAQVVLSELRKMAARVPRRALRVLDVATGGGDVALGVARLARAGGVSIEVAGCDVSPTAIRLARENAKRLNCPEVRFFDLDVIHGVLPRDYDVVLSTLFLHHLSNEEALDLLSRMAQAGRVGGIVDDLLRTRIGYWLAWVGCRVLSRSPIVHTDGPLSVRAAFSSVEVLELAARAKITAPSFRRHWPQRFVLSWSHG